jgi:predicted DCC family thiol-disulfide oxidoreductase YuxK
MRNSERSKTPGRYDVSNAFLKIMVQQPPERPFLIFDGECSFCRAWVEYWKQLTDGVLYVPYQEIGDRFPEISGQEFAAAVQLILPSGEAFSGAHAVFQLLALVPGKSSMLWLYERLPGFALVADALYGWIARHRSFAYKLTKYVLGVPLEPENFGYASWIFLRLLGLIYLIAFLSFGVQASGLIGSHGILPAADFLRAVGEYLGTARFWSVPTLLWVNASDAMILTIWVAGVIFSVLLAVGINWRLVRVALFVLYLSLVTTGQGFMTYQWDALLLEAGFLTIFLGSSRLIVKLFRWLLFRLVFLSGAVKLLSHDPSWHNFTALPFHYETQPLPTPVAWYFYQFPPTFQRVSVGFVFFVELLIPFLILAPRRLRVLAAFAITLLQILIALTGNYAFFNLLTVALCLFLLDDAFFRRRLSGSLMNRIPLSLSESSTRPLVRRACFMLYVLVLFVSGFEMAGMFSGAHWAVTDKVISAVAPLEVVNTYGLFAVMTTTRGEIVVEGSNDGAIWLEYEFKYKPGELNRRPPWVAPYQPRLDWQMWFAALGDYRSDPWVLQFMARILEGSPQVLKLVHHNPFPNASPRYLRAMLYQYRFTTPAQRRSTGAWWRRELKGEYVPTVSLSKLSEMKESGFRLQLSEFRTCYATDLNALRAQCVVCK